MSWNLARPIALRGRERGKDVRRQDVAADDGEVGRRLVARRLLDEIAHLIDAVAEVRVGLDGDDAVARDVLARHALDGEHRTVDPLEHVDQLLDRRRIRVDHVVAQDDREGLVADQLARDEHGVAEAERLALAHVGEVDQVRDLADLVELLALAARLEKRLELDRDVEVIFDRVLAAAGHQDDVVDARRDRLLDAVLNDRLVDERQHFLRLRFGGGQETGAETGGRKDRLADGRHPGIVAEAPTRGEYRMGRKR